MGAVESGYCNQQFTGVNSTALSHIRRFQEGKPIIVFRIVLRFPSRFSFDDLLKSFLAVELGFHVVCQEKSESQCRKFL